MHNNIIIVTYMEDNEYQNDRWCFFVPTNKPEGLLGSNLTNSSRFSQGNKRKFADPSLLILECFAYYYILLIFTKTI